MLKYRHELKHRHGEDTILVNECAGAQPDPGKKLGFGNLFSFVFTFVLPKPRKQRLIVVRDELGRIVSSQVPAIRLA